MLTKAAGMPVGKGGSYDWNALVKEAGLCVTSIHEDLGTIRREPETVAKEAEAFAQNMSSSRECTALITRIKPRCRGCAGI